MAKFLKIIIVMHLFNLLGNLLTSLEDWQLLVELVNDLDHPLPDRERSDQMVSECVSTDQVVSTSTAGEGHNDRTEHGYSAVSGAELTQFELLKLMLGSLPPLMVNKLLSSCRGNCFGGKTREQLHSILSKLTSIHTQQRY